MLLFFFILFPKVPLARKPETRGRDKGDKSKSTVSGKSETKWGGNDKATERGGMKAWSRVAGYGGGAGRDGGSGGQFVGVNRGKAESM